MKKDDFAWFAGSYSTQKEIDIAKNLQVTLKNN